MCGYCLVDCLKGLNVFEFWSISVLILFFAHSVLLVRISVFYVKITDIMSGIFFRAPKENNCVTSWVGLVLRGCMGIYKATGAAIAVIAPLAVVFFTLPLRRLFYNLLVCSAV